MERIISVKSGEVVEKEGKEWIEIVDNENKKHRIFPSMQKVDGACWCPVYRSVG